MNEYVEIVSRLMDRVLDMLLKHVEREIDYLCDGMVISDREDRVLCHVDKANNTYYVDCGKYLFVVIKNPPTGRTLVRAYKQVM